MSSTAWKNRLLGLRGREAGTITLAQHRIFILPTLAGLAFATCLLLMLVTSVNYGLSLGFGLTFLLASLGFVTILHAFRNLLGLEIRAGRCESVFVGDRLQFPLTLTNTRRHSRPALLVRWGGNGSLTVHLPPQGEQQVLLGIPTQRRGYAYSGRITLETRYPLGLARAWSHAEPDARCLVYPEPECAAPALPPAREDSPGSARRGAGQEDFAALRPHQPSDSPRHVAWKAVARGAPLVTKQFAGGGSSVLQFDWNDLPLHLDVEGRLSRLTRWIIDAERDGRAYGLRLPGTDLPADSGEKHFRACLQALALYGQADA